MDSSVQDYIRKLHLAGGVVNRAIVITAAGGIVQHNNPSLLIEHGGTIQLGKKWADPLMTRMNYVKRKATKAARKVPVNFPEIKLAFLKLIVDRVKEHNIPPELIINFDQTGTKYVPTSEWTLAEEGLKHVNVIGKEDKREGYTPFRRRRFVTCHFVTGTLRHQPFRRGYSSSPGHFIASRFVAGTLRHPPFCHGDSLSKDDEDDERRHVDKDDGRRLHNLHTNILNS